MGKRRTRLPVKRDPHVNALGIKGVGEIGITGSAGAVANAVPSNLRNGFVTNPYGRPISAPSR